MNEKYHFSGSTRDKLEQRYWGKEKTTGKVKVAGVRSGVKADQSFHSRSRLEDTIKAASG